MAGLGLTGLFDLNSQSSAWVPGQWGQLVSTADIDHGQLSIDWCFTGAVPLHSSLTNNSLTTSPPIRGS